MWKTEAPRDSAVCYFWNHFRLKNNGHICEKIDAGKVMKLDEISMWRCIISKISIKDSFCE